MRAIISSDEFSLNMSNFLYSHFLQSEQALFSSKIKKINMFNWVQERILIITETKVYNFKKKAVKRAIQIEAIEGVSKTTLPGSKEFTLHIPSEYDYRFIAD